MKNTGIIYPSTEKTPVVLPEFETLLPPLGPEQLAALEAALQASGCYAPLIVDENLTLIDGHNRLKICGAHGIPYTMLVFSFALEAKRWALDTQKGRRNLSLWELGQSVVASCISFASPLRGKAHSFRCSSFPNRTRCAGLRFGKTGAPGKPLVFLGRGGARERAQFSPSAETEISGLCDDDKGAPKSDDGTGCLRGKGQGSKQTASTI